MSGLNGYRTLFRLAGVYDLVLGLSFAIGHATLLQALNVTLPNHPGYVQLPALFIAVMGIADFRIAADLARNRDLIFIRILMKLAYSLLCFYYKAIGWLPEVWLWIAVLNFAFIVPYLLCLRELRRASS